MPDSAANSSGLGGDAMKRNDIIRELQQREKDLEYEIRWSDAGAERQLLRGRLSELLKILVMLGGK